MGIRLSTRVARKIKATSTELTWPLEGRGISSLPFLSPKNAHFSPFSLSPSNQHLLTHSLHFAQPTHPTYPTPPFTNSLYLNMYVLFFHVSPHRSPPHPDSHPPPFPFRLFRFLFLPLHFPSRSGKGKSGKASTTEGGDSKKTTSRSAKAGLQFPVGRIHRLLKKGNYAQRVGAGAPVYLAAVLECELYLPVCMCLLSLLSLFTDVFPFPLILLPRPHQTSPLRSSSSLVTLPETTRSRESSPDTFSSPSETTRSLTSFSVTSSSPRVVSFPRFSPSFSLPSRASLEEARPARLLRRFRWIDGCRIPSIFPSLLFSHSARASLRHPCSFPPFAFRSFYLFRLLPLMMTCRLTIILLLFYEISAGERLDLTAMRPIPNPVDSHST